MKYRLHQEQMIGLCREILDGAPIKQIIAAVTPGGGKSKLPVILAQMLIPRFADRIVWVAPRNSLKYQGEGEFLDPRFPTSKRMRATNGNEAELCKGVDGYLTTYQAVGQDPSLHARFFREHRTILFLDESHHVADNKSWADAIAPLRSSSVLTVDASGTLARGDGQRIHGLEYDGAFVDLSDRNHVRIIQYSRAQALRDGAILPVAFRYLDGKTEWEQDGERHSADTLSGGDYVAQALFTALRTGYAFEMLDLCLKDWREAQEAYPAGKLLVVAPSIALAEQYQAHMHKRRVESLIATSQDTTRAREAINRFKGHALPSTNVLVTCQLAYEGLSVPAVTHIACLTHIRSVPWLEQCFARANRTAPGKTRGVVFGPNDPRFREAIAAIEAEQIQALQEREEERGDSLEEAEGAGGGRKWIQPLRSEAIRPEGEPLFDEDGPEEESAPHGGLAISQAEKLLRKQIAQHIEILLAGKRAGSKAAHSKIVHHALKEIVGGKAREECTVEELTAQWAELKRRWPV